MIHSAIEFRIAISAVFFYQHRPNEIFKLIDYSRTYYNWELKKPTIHNEREQDEFIFVVDRHVVSATITFSFILIHYLFVIFFYTVRYSNNIAAIIDYKVFIKLYFFCV